MQTQGWLQASRFETIVNDKRSVLRSRPRQARSTYSLRHQSIRFRLLPTERPFRFARSAGHNEFFNTPHHVRKERIR